MQRILFIIISFFLAFIILELFQKGNDMGELVASAASYEGTIPAQEFPEGMEWLNTAKPLRLQDLRGKIVLLDFWTYCCINCMHVIPDLKKLEKKYPDELVVIGVHSAKFTGERETENIRQAVKRYEIEHPVVNDNQMMVWQMYGVRAWPTLVLIDPVGKIIGSTSGEGIYEPFDKIITEVIKTFDTKGLLDRRPLKITADKRSEQEGLLSFPGKVLADEKSKRLFIADSNHNRIVIVSLDNINILGVVGAGQVGLKDGSWQQTRFNHPQGMALDGDVLYVADTENHAIRRVDLAAQTVVTIAGTGNQATWGAGGGRANRVELNSPWDLALDGDNLYIAMAGSHQIWKMDLRTNRVRPYAGSGREARIDGPLTQAALAQPSGLAIGNGKLYVADSEVSSIRSVDLNPGGRVDTIVGGDLFDFGDQDGQGLEARLQHPLGVAYREGFLYVADTYNNKIKRIRLADNMLESFLEAGTVDGIGGFDEPAGLSIAGDMLYVADTNHHRICRVDLKNLRVYELNIR
jgi:sugar lactone lactonase YvrE/cytochrome oxidase Cu insertion factor (SCO1/SenC/PrrC family)